MMMTQSLWFIVCLITWAPYIWLSCSLIHLAVHRFSWDLMRKAYFHVLQLDFTELLGLVFILTAWQIFQLNHCSPVDNFSCHNVMLISVLGFIWTSGTTRSEAQLWNVVWRSRRALSGSPTHSMKSVENLTTRSRAKLWTVVQEFGN